MNPNSLSVLALAGNRDMNDSLVRTGSARPIRKHLPESAALIWLTTAARPHASTAAIHLPSLLMLG
jgi:hypothetical protein